MQHDSSFSDTLLEAASRHGGAAEIRCRLVLERASGNRALRAAIQGELARVGLTESGFAALSILLSRRPRSVSCTEVATAMELPAAGCSDLFTRLELSGLVSRSRGEPDRRLVRYSLTSAGASCIERALDRYVATVKKVTGLLDLNDLKASIAVEENIREGAANLDALSSDNTES